MVELSREPWEADPIIAWADLDGVPRAKRRYLEQRLSLLSAASERVLCMAALRQREAMEAIQAEITALAGTPDAAPPSHLTDDLEARKAAFLRYIRHAVVLQAILQRGITHTALEDGLIDANSAFVLEVPPWLEEVERWAIGLQGRYIAENEHGPILARWDQLVKQAQKEVVRDPTGIDPRVIADLIVARWTVLRLTPQARVRADLKRERQLLETACAAYPADRYPHQQCLKLINLAYWYLLPEHAGVAANQERGIALIEEAIARCPAHYDATAARAKLALARVLLQRFGGKPDDNMKRGIALSLEAIESFPEEVMPVEHADVLGVLATLVQKSPNGGRRENSELAIYLYRKALALITPTIDPDGYHTYQFNLAAALMSRAGEDPVENAELALASLAEAQRALPLAANPTDRARQFIATGNALLNRPATNTFLNSMNAIIEYRAALRHFTRRRSPIQYALIQNNLALAYMRLPFARFSWARMAIRAHRRALRVYDPVSFPKEHADTLFNLGNVYTEMPGPRHAAELRRAIAIFQDVERIALQIGDRNLQRNVYLSMALAAGRLRDWATVHAVYTRLFPLEDSLLRDEITPNARGAFLKESRDGGLRDAYALAMQGRAAEAAVAIEIARTRHLFEERLVEPAIEARVTDPALRARFAEARHHFAEARRKLYALTRTLSGRPADQESLETHLAFSQRHFEEEFAVVEAFRAARNRLDAAVRDAPALADFLREAVTPASLIALAEGVAPGHAIIALVATPWGGMAVGTFAAWPAQGKPAAIKTMLLPKLTSDVLGDLMVRHWANQTLRVMGGFNYAQRGVALDAFLFPNLVGNTIRTRATFMAMSAPNRPGQTLTLAAQQLLRIPELEPYVDTPFAELQPEIFELWRETFAMLFLNAELAYVFPILREIVMAPLYEWLRCEHVSGVTLIPCGWLETFPLTSIQLYEGFAANAYVPISVAPNAQALARDPRQRQGRTGLFALGDPAFTGFTPLPWSEAEAYSIAKIARILGLSRTLAVGGKAQRTTLIQKLREAEIILCSCHGSFDAFDYLRSSLILAHGERLTLEDILAREADVRGARLIILSACQSGLSDLRNATDENRNLAGGIVQAGAWAVLATLWPVDDPATYVLITKFASLWLPTLHDRLPPAQQLAPAQALASAQAWMRTVTVDELRYHWHPTLIVAPPDPEITIAGAADSWVHPASTAFSETGAPRIAIRGRGYRYTHSQAEAALYKGLAVLPGSDRPYADPFFWAGFQIVGW